MENNITVYSLPSCNKCKALKKYLIQNQIEFIDIDVSKDYEAQRDVVIKTGQIFLPVIMINNESVVGFNKKKINELLKINKNA